MANIVNPRDQDEDEVGIVKVLASMGAGWTAELCGKHVHGGAIVSLPT